MSPQNRVVSACLLVALTLLPVAAPAAGQIVEGDLIASSGPRTAGPAVIDACGFMDANAEYTLGADDVFSYEFPVDEATIGRPFVLVPETFGDLDIAFFGTDGQWVYDERDIEGEIGIVPNADFASVCLVASPPTHFTYSVS